LSGVAMAAASLHTFAHAVRLPSVEQLSRKAGQASLIASSWRKATDAQPTGLSVG
jgi:hypothetical protein